MSLAQEGVRVLLIGTGTHDGPFLEPLPSVARTVRALAERLVSRCGAAPANIRMVLDEPTAEGLARAVAQEAEAARGCLLIYYVGHGQIGPDGDLYLSARGTDRLTSGQEGYQALSLSAVRRAVDTSRATTVAVVLDCCHSGRASLGDRSPRQQFSLPSVHGMYFMGAADSLALAPVDAEYTELTGELIRLLDQGDPRGPRQLTLDSAYAYLFREMRANGAASRGWLRRRLRGRRAAAPAVRAGRSPVAAGGAEPGEHIGGRGPLLAADGCGEGGRGLGAGAQDQVVVGGDDLGDGGQVPLEQVAVTGQAVAGQRGAQLVEGGRPGYGRVLHRRLRTAHRIGPELVRRR